MSLDEKIGEVALNLAKNENIQNKTVELLGMLFPYAGLTKKAVDMYISEIEMSDMSTEAKVFSVMNAKKTIKKIKNQKQIADIAMENAKEGTDFTETSGVNEEWLERFMDSAGFVSSEDIQLIWGKVLANEFEKPGTTPPNMIRILSEMTPTYAKAFRVICSMQVLFLFLDNEDVVNSEWQIIVPFEENIDYMRKYGLSFEILNELETLGVIKFEAVAGYISTDIQEERLLVHSNEKTLLAVAHNKGCVPIGNVLLTTAGEALRQITPVDRMEGYTEALEKYMKANSVKFAENVPFKVFVNGEDYQVLTTDL